MEVIDTLYRVLFFIIDFFTVVMAIVSFAILFVAMHTMVRNRAFRWDNLFFIPILLLLFAWGLQVVPALFVRSSRVGLEAARPEAQLLGNELRQWLPARDSFSGTTFTAATSVISTPAPTALVSTPGPTVTPWPTIEATPMPTMAGVDVISTAQAMMSPTATPFNCADWQPGQPPPRPGACQGER